MAEAARLSIILEGDTSEFESALNAVERGLNKAASVATSTGGSVGGVFNSVGAGAVAMGSLIASGVTTAANALVGLGQSALGAVVDFEKMQAQMTAMTAVELVDQGKFKDFDSAYDTAIVKSKELLDWSQKLAVVSPYEGADVARVSAAAQAFGFLTTQFKTAEEAQRAGVITVQRLTEGILNFGAATGKTGATLDNISMIAGQIKAAGKLMGGDSMQLKNMGINLEGDIAKQLGKTTGQVVEMREKGLIPAQLALDTLMASLEKYGSAAEKQGNSLGGLLASLSDLSAIAQRDLFGGIFRSLQPKIQEAVTALQDPAFKAALVSIGETAGQAVTQALTELGRLASGAQAALGALKAGFAAAGAGGAAFNLLTMLGIDPDTAANVGAVLNNIVSAVQTGINAVKGAIAGFQSGGAAGGLSGFLTGLGLGPEVASQAVTVLNQITAAIQTGVNAVKAAVAGFASGGVGGGATALLTALGVDPSTAAQVGAVMGQIASAIQTGLGVAIAVIGLASQGFVSILPALMTVASVAGGVLVGAFQVLAGVVGFVAQNWQVFASVLAGVVAALAASGLVGTITTIIAAIQGLGIVIAGAGGIMGAITTVMGVVAGAFALPIAPIAILIGIIAALAVAWATNMGNIQGNTSVYIQQIIANWQQLVGYVGGVQQFLGDVTTMGIGDAWGRLTERIGQINADFQNNLNSIAASAAETSNSASGSFETMAGNASTMGQLVQAVTSGNFGAIPGIVGGAMSAANDNLSGAVSAMVANVTNGANIIKGTLASIASAAAAVGGIAADASFGPALDQGQITGRTDPASIAQKNAEFAQKTVQLAQSYQQVAASFNKVTPAVAAAGAAGGGAGAAAKSAEDKIQQANQALQSTIKTVTDLNEMLKNGLDGLTVGEGADKIVQLAGQVAALGRRIAEVFGAAMKGMSEDASKAAQTGASAIGSASQALGSLVGMLPKLVEFLGSEAWAEISAAPGAIVSAASQIIAIGKSIADIFMAAMGNVSDEAAKSAQNGAAVIGAASQALSSMVGLLPKLWEFINDPAFDEIMAAQGEVVEAARQIIQLGKAISDAFLSAMGSVSDETAKTAQNGAAVIGAATQSINSLIDTIKKIVDFTADVGYAAAIFTEEGRANILSAASALITLGADMFSIFSSVMGDVSAKSAAAAKRASEGLVSMGQGLTAIVDSVVKLTAFMHDGLNNIHINNTLSRGALIEMTRLLSSLGVLMLEQFALAGATVSSLGVAAAKRLADGLQAVGGGVASVIDAVVKMTSFIHDGMNTVHILSAESRGALIELARLLSELGREIFNQWVAASVDVSQYHVDASQRLSDGVKAATDGILAGISAVEKMTMLMHDAALSAYVVPGAARQSLFYFAQLLSVVAREIYNQWVNVSADVSQYHVDAAKRLADGVGAGVGALTQTIDFIVKLLSFAGDAAARLAIAEANRNALFAVVIDLAQFAREVYNQWVAASVAVSQYHVDAAKRLSEGVQSAVSAVTGAMDLVASLFKFAGDSVMRAIVGSVGARAWFARLATALAQFIEDTLEAFDTFGVDVTQDMIDRAARLGSGADAASQTITGSIGSLTALFKFAGDAALVAAVTSQSARQNIALLAAALGQFIEDTLEAFDTFGVGVTQALVDGAKRLADGAAATLNVVRDALETFVLLNKTLADGLSLDMGAALDLIHTIADWASQLAVEFLTVANTFTGEITDAARAFADGVGMALSVSRDALELFTLFKTTLAEGPLDMSGAEFHPEFIDALAAYAISVAGAFLLAANTFTGEVTDAAKALGEGLSLALGVSKNALEILALFTKTLAEGPLNMSGAELHPEFIDAITRYAMDVTLSFLLAANTFTGVVAEAATRLGNGLDLALSVSKNALEILSIFTKTLASGPLNMAGAEYHPELIDALARYAMEVALAFLLAANTFTGTVTEAATRLGSGLDLALSVSKNALEILSIFVKTLSTGPLNMAGAEYHPELIDALARYAMDVALSFLLAANTFTGNVTDAARTLDEGLNLALGASKNALELLALFIKTLSSGPLNMAGAEYHPELIDALARYAMDVAGAFLLAANTFTGVVADAAHTLDEGLNLALGASKNALEILALFTKTLSNGPLNMSGAEYHPELIDALARYAMEVALAFLLAANTFTGVVAEAAQALDSGINLALGVSKNALEILALFTKTLASGPLNMAGAEFHPEFVDALARYAMEVAAAFLLAANTFTGTVADAAKEFEAGLSMALSASKNTLELFTLFVTTLAKGPLNMAGAEFHPEFIDALTRYAIDVAGAFLTVANTFTGTVTDAAKALGEALSQSLGVVKDVLEFNELQSTILNFRGFDMTKIGPKLDLIFTAAIAIAQEFGRRATSAGITEAWQEAGAALSDLFGNAASSLKDALDLGGTLLDPETQIPSIGQIQGKVDALFNVITAIATQFAAKAQALAQSGINTELAGKFGEQVKSVFEGIREVAAAISDFTGVSLGMSGFNNISQILTAVFGLFDQVRGQAGMVNEVSAAIASVLGGLGNLVQAQAFSAGVSIGQSIAAGIAAGITGATASIGTAVAQSVVGGSGSAVAQAVTANSGSAAPAPVTPTGGTATPSQTIYNAPQTYAPVFINIVNTNPAVQADVTNQAILLSSQFGRGL